MCEGVCVSHHSVHPGGSRALASVDILAFEENGKWKSTKLISERQRCTVIRYKRKKTLHGTRTKRPKIRNRIDVMGRQKTFDIDGALF